MKRIRVNLPTESKATQDGIRQRSAQAEGYDCACGKHHEFGAYAVAHWNEVLQRKCPACGRVHKMKGGVVTEFSGPAPKKSKIKKPEQEQADPRKPMWRAYHVFHNTGQPVTYSPASNFYPTLEQANAEAWEYANRVEPNRRERREELYNFLIRREEFPLLSTIITDGLIVGGGELQAVGISQSDLLGRAAPFFELRDPKGRVSRVTLTPEVFARLMEEWGYEKKKS